MNLRTCATIAVVAFISAYAYGVIQFNIGWRAGVKDLEQKMIQEAQDKLEKQITRQQADDIKASVDNANNILGYDGETVQSTTAGK